jgi:predicted dinucleotide-binding enzyme
MKIGILGSGDVGKQLGLGLLRLGHHVKIGTRDVSKLSKWLEEADKKASTGSFSEAAAFGEIVFLATLWTGTEQAINLAGKQNFKNKIVVDVTNPLDFSKGAPPKLLSAPAASAGEKIQHMLPDAKVVKAFNTISAFIMIDAAREEGTPDLFIAGHKEGKKFVTEIALEWGWHSVIDLGDIAQAYLLEAQAMLWITYGFRNNSWSHAFKLLIK